MRCRVMLQVAIGIALGVLVALALWHGIIRWLPWWAQGCLGGLIIIALLMWGCCCIGARADEIIAARTWRANVPRVIGEDAAYGDNGRKLRR